MSETLRAAGIATDGLIRLEDRPTTTKNMIISGENPVMRLDVEDARPVCATSEAALIWWMQTHLAMAGAVVVSDYEKGAVTETLARSTIDAAGRLGVPVIVDPKGPDFARYRGATVVTPSVREAECIRHRHRGWHQP